MSDGLTNFKVRRLLDCEKMHQLGIITREEGTDDYYGRVTGFYVSGRYRGRRVASYRWVSNAAITYGMFDLEKVFRQHLLSWCQAQHDDNRRIDDMLTADQVAQLRCQRHLDKNLPIDTPAAPMV